MPRKRYPSQPCPGRCGRVVWDATKFCSVCQMKDVDPADPGKTGFRRVHRGELPGETFEDLFFTPLEPTGRELRQMSLLP